MRVHAPLAAALAVSLLSMMPVRAEADAPAHLLPTKDVTVIYALSGAKAGQSGRPAEGKLSFSATLGQARVEAERRPGYLLLDPQKNRATLVLTQMNIYVGTAISGTPVGSLILSPSEHFSRQGESTVAGIPCTLWHVTAAKGEGTVCLSEDGILLSGQGTDQQGRKGSLQATTVRYEPQPDALFQVPPDYQQMDLPPGLVQGLLSGSGQGRLPGLPSGGSGGGLGNLRMLLGR